MERESEAVRKPVELLVTRASEESRHGTSDITAKSLSGLGRSGLPISLVLRVGVLSSSALMVAGLLVAALSLDRGGDITASPFSSTVGANALTSPVEVLTLLWQGDPIAVIALGLLLIMLTPIAQVFLSLISFWRERDRPFILIASGMLAILVAGLTWAR